MSSASSAAWETSRRILCVRLDTIGDLLMTSPAIRAVKESGPGRHVTLLTSTAGAATAALIPEIDDVIVYDSPWMKATAPRASSAPELAMIARLRAGNFDAAVVFTVFSQNPIPATMLCYLADIPLRLAHCHENTYQLLTDWVPDPEPQGGIRHEVQRQLDLVAAVGYETPNTHLSLRVPPEADRHVAAVLGELALDPARPWLVLHAGATASSRRYPPEYFAAAAHTLVSEDGWQIIFTGSPSESDLIARIQAHMGAPSHALIGTLDLAALAALIARAPLLLTNNTGPAHIAAAVGTPVVDIYAMTNPQHTPWNVPSRVVIHDVPCRNCFKADCPLGHHDCLRKIPPGAVVAAVLDLWRERNERGEGAFPPFSPTPSQAKPASANAGERPG